MNVWPLSNDTGRLTEVPWLASAVSRPPVNCPISAAPCFMSKLMPTLRRGVSIDFGHRDHEHDLLFARHPQEVDEVRVSFQEFADGVDRRLLVAQAGDESHVDAPGLDLAASPRGRMFRDDAENLRRLDNVLRLAAHHDLLAHQRELNGAVGKCFLDFSFQYLERLLEGFHLGLQTPPLFQHVERGAFRIGQDDDHVAQRPVLPLVVRIARIGEPKVQNGPARLLADDGKFLVGDDLKTGHVLVGDVDAARLLSQYDDLGPADDHLDRVLRSDFALDELPILPLDLRRRLGGAQSRRKAKRRQTELSRDRTAMRRFETLPCRLGRRLDSRGQNARPAACPEPSEYPAE